MLSRKEKEEFVADGLSAKRRSHFAAIKVKYKAQKAPFKDYFRFLEGLDRIFGPITARTHKTITSLNKL